MNDFYGPNNYNLADETRQTHGIIHLILELKVHEGRTIEFCLLLFFLAPNTIDWLNFKKGVGKEKVGWMRTATCFIEQTDKFEKNREREGLKRSTNKRPPKAITREEMSRECELTCLSKTESLGSSGK